MGREGGVGGSFRLLGFAWFRATNFKMKRRRKAKEQ